MNENGEKTNKQTYILCRKQKNNTFQIQFLKVLIPLKINDTNTFQS